MISIKSVIVICISVLFLTSGSVVSFSQENGSAIEQAHAYATEDSLSRAIGTLFRPYGSTQQDVSRTKDLLDKAVQTFLKAAESDASDFSSIFSLGRICYINGQRQEAWQYLSEAVELGKGSSGKFRVEIETAKRVLNDILLRSVLDSSEDIKTVVERGVQLLQGDDPQQALIFFDHIEKDPALGMLIVSRPEIFNPFYQVLDVFERKCAGDGVDAKTHYILGRLYKFKAMITTSVHLNLPSATQEGELVTEPAAKSVAGQQQDLFDRAVREFKKAVGLESDFAEAHFYLGKTYSVMKDYNKAIASVEKAIDGNPYNQQYYEYLGGLYIIIGDLDRADRNFDKALKTLDDWIYDPSGLLLERKKIEILKTHIRKDDVAKFAQGEDAFSGTWKLTGDELMRMEEPYLSEEQVRQDHVKMKEKLQSLKVVSEFMLQQQGHQLRFVSEIGEAKGFCYDHWFVLALEEEERPEDLATKKGQIFTGEMGSDGTLLGTWFTEQKTVDPDQHPSSNFILEYTFKARKIE